MYWFPSAVLHKENCCHTSKLGGKFNIGKKSFLIDLWMIVNLCFLVAWRKSNDSAFCKGWRPWQTLSKRSWKMLNAIFSKLLKNNYRLLIYIVIWIYQSNSHLKLVIILFKIWIWKMLNNIINYSAMFYTLKLLILM